MTNTTIEHVCEHPDRKLLDGVGGVPLSRTRLIYNHLVERNDPKNPSLPLRPYNPGLPRVHGGTVYNGGAPWLPGYSGTHMTECLVETRYRFKLRHPPGEIHVIDHEDDATNAVLADPNANPNHLYRALELYNSCVNSDGDGPWAFPRHEWYASIIAHPFVWREAILHIRRFHLDGYRWYQWNDSQHAAALARLARCLVALGRDPADAVVYHWPFMPGDPTKMHTPESWAFGFRAAAGVGFRRHAVWHEGNEGTRLNSDIDKRFRASLAFCNSPDIRAAFPAFGGGAA